MKFLIVDDNAGIRKTIKTILSEKKADFMECSNGSGIVEAYELFRPDIVLMDIEMPEINGIAATGMLKSSYPDAKVILLTSYNDEEFQLQSLSVGADAYLYKENLVKLYEYIHCINNSEDQI